MDAARTFRFQRPPKGARQSRAHSGSAPALHAQAERALGGALWGVGVTAVLILVTSPPLSEMALWTIAVAGALEGIVICGFRKQEEGRL